MAVVNKFNINKEQVTLDADIIENMSANDVSYNSSSQYDENTVGDKLSELEYDVTANNDGITFASLSALLSSENLSTLIPVSVRHGGMSIRFVQSSDNKYVQYFLTKDEWSVSEADWEKINLLDEVSQLDQKVEGITNEHIFQSSEKIEIFDNSGNKVAEINPEFSNFKKLKSNGEEVLTSVKSSYPSTSDKIIIESNEGNFIAEFSEEELNALSNIRRKIYISSTDTEYDILNKFILADINGNTDIIFKRSTYVLTNIYTYMRDTLGWTGNRFGLPIGHNNRYYFNGSTIISNNPTGFTNVRDVLVTRTINGDYELYDGIIINNTGQYCIHDEGGGYSILYSHYYKNMVLKYDGTSGQPFGCGTGFDANLSFEECIFETSWTGAITFAIHGPIVNPNKNPVSVDLRFNGCYFNSQNVGINQEYFDGSRDNLFLLIENCKMQGDVSDNNFEILSFNNSISKKL